MLLNSDNKFLQIKIDGNNINLIQDDSVFPLSKLQSCLPTYETLGHIEVLYIHISYSFSKSAIEFMSIASEISRLLKSFKKVQEFQLSLDFNPEVSVLSNLDIIMNVIQHLPIRVFTFKHSCDYLVNIEYFIKHLALNVNIQLQEINLHLKILKAKGLVNSFNKLLQNLKILIQKNQNLLKKINLTLFLLEYEDVLEMDYQLLSAILECQNLNKLMLLTNVLPNQYLPLPPSFTNPQILHFQNLTELCLEFNVYEASRLELSKQMYLMCFQRITSLRMKNAIDSISSLNISEINQEIKVFSFAISNTQHQFSVNDYNSLKQISGLKNLVHLTVTIDQPSTISSREHSCIAVAKDLLSSLNDIVHFEMRVKGFLGSQNFLQFLNIIREKQFLIRLKQVLTSPGLQKLMGERRSLIKTLVNKKDYFNKISSLFRRDVIIDMLYLKMNIQN